MKLWDSSHPVSVFSEQVYFLPKWLACKTHTKCCQHTPLRRSTSGGGVKKGWKITSCLPPSSTYLKEGEKRLLIFCSHSVLVLTLDWGIWACPDPQCPGTSQLLTGIPLHAATKQTNPSSLPKSLSVCLVVYALQQTVAEWKPHTHKPTLFLPLPPLQFLLHCYI